MSSYTWRWIATDVSYSTNSGAKADMAGGPGWAIGRSRSILFDQTPSAPASVAIDRSKFLAVSAWDKNFTGQARTVDLID
jgi:hypothetical protein